VYHRTMHMLRPARLSITQITRSELEMDMVRAERLDKIWSSKITMQASPRHSHRLQIGRKHEGRPVTLMGDYIIFNPYLQRSTCYRWISLPVASRLGPESESGSVAFVYEVPRCIATVHHMNHGLQTFYLVFAVEPAKLADERWSPMSLIQSKL
jgi:hypothetical protein